MNFSAYLHPLGTGLPGGHGIATASCPMAPHTVVFCVTAFDTEMPRYPYELRLFDAGEVQRYGAGHAPAVPHRTEPGRTWWSRAMLCLLSLPPVDRRP